MFDVLTMYEKVPGGSVADMIDKMGRLQLNCVRHFTAQIVQGLGKLLIHYML